MTQRLHLVFGGELTDPSRTAFKFAGHIHAIGIFPDHDSACNALKTGAQRTADNAQMHGFTARIHHLRNDSTAASATEELGN